MKGKTIAAVLLVLSLIGFGVLVWVDHADAVRERERLESMAKQYDEHLDRLVNELEEIEEELKTFDVNDTGDAGKGMAGYCVLITQPRYEIVSEIEPLLTEYGIPGHVCLSESSFPDDEDNISSWQMDELLDMGWDLCITVNGDTDISALIERMREWELPDPVGAYFPDPGAVNAKASELGELGISTIFVGSLEDGSSDSAVRPVRFINSDDTDFRSSAEACAASGETFALRVSPEEYGQGYQFESFRNSVAAAEELRSAGSLKLYTVAEAGEWASRHFSEISSALDQNRKHLEELIARQEEIRSEISTLNRGE